MKRRKTNSVYAVAALVLGLAFASSIMTRASPQEPRDIDYTRLHRDWARFLPPGTVCEWPTYHVDQAARRGGTGTAEDPFATLEEALAAADDEQVCGPTVVLQPGRYEVGRVVLAKPTILRGQIAAAVIVGTFVNVSPIPLWMEQLTIADAPAPGAVLAAHPDAEATLVEVAIENATGFGILLRGGRLDLRDVSIEGSRAAERTDVASETGWLARLWPRLKPYIPSHLGRLQESVDALPDGVLGPTLTPDFSIKEPFDFGSAFWSCMGTGLYVSGGGYANLTGNSNSFSSNANAGISVADQSSYVEGENVSAHLNGILGPPPPHGNVVALLESGYCLGGIQVRQEGFVNLKNVAAVGNKYFGVVIHHGGMSFFDQLVTNANGDYGFPNTGEGMVGFKGSLAAQNFESFGNERNGIVIQGTPHFYLFNGLSTQNAIGVATDYCPIENYLLQHNVAVVGNAQADIVTLSPPCNLGVPSAPPLPRGG
jgi:hypothetical protein